MYSTGIYTYENKGFKLQMHFHLHIQERIFKIISLIPLKTLFHFREEKETARFIILKCK